MSEIHRFLFDGLPVRGIVVRLTEAWAEILRRRASNTHTGPYAEPVRELLGEMLAAATLMQANIKFDGTLIMQLHGDGPVKLAVAEVRADLSLRATATVTGEVVPDATLPGLVNPGGGARCAITLDPQTRFPGQQPYQGVVPLVGDHGEPLQKLSEVLEHYMLQSEQLDTTLVLAADAHVAAGLLIQRLPTEGVGNLEGARHSEANENEIGRNEDYRRISMLARTLKREELLGLDVDTILRRLFWEEPHTRLAAVDDTAVPRFACTCSRAKVATMITGLGEAEAHAILGERGQIEVGCEFCGQQYRFDAVDADSLFRSPRELPPSSSTPQ